MLTAVPGARADAVDLRLDIQCLRALAVLAVVLYHAKLFPLAGGFLGVDIFFVISGYLITRHIVQDIDLRRFSFGRFYARRVRRLLPAAYSTLFVTCLLAACVLTPDRWADFQAQVLGTLSFTANFVLPLQTGYFEASAESKPLLHTWSLSVEEQYYLFAPLLLVLMRPAWRQPVLAGLAVLSLALCLVLVSWHLEHWRLPQLNSAQLAFFMLPARAWEMLAGSVLACWSLQRPRTGPPPALRWAGLVTLCALLVWPLDRAHPRIDAVAVVALTALLVAGRGDWIGRSPAVRLIGRVGDLSYSLYLVHWPLLSLAHSAYLGEVPWPVRAGLVLLTLLLAALQYHAVEQRFRAGSAGQRGLVVLALASLALAILPACLSWLRHDGADAYAYLRQSNRGLSAACAAGRGVDDPAACSTGATPRVAVWGDSYAMHLIPGLQRLPGTGDALLQLTKTACAPVRGVASLDAHYDEVWAQGCVAFNERALRLLAHLPSVTTVVLSSPFAGYLDEGPLTVFHDGARHSADRTLAITAFTQTLQQLHAVGKKTVVVAPPPRPGFDAGACQAQRGSGLLVLGRADCNFRLTDARRRQAGILAGLATVGERSGTPVLWLDGPICPEGLCRTALADGTAIYKDDGHLSIPGSVWLIGQTRLPSLLGP